MKYLIKNQTSKTIWKKILVASSTASNVNAPSLETEKAQQRSIAALNTQTYPVRKYGVKLATWSRGFDFTPFYQQNVSTSPQKMVLLPAGGASA